MLPVKLISLVQRSHGHHTFKMTYCKLKFYNYKPERHCSGQEVKHKSSLYAKVESKGDQMNVPVELDLDFKRLEVKDQLKSELSSRNITDVDVDKLQRDYNSLINLNNRRTELERRKDLEITSNVTQLVQKKEITSDPDEIKDIDKTLKELQNQGKIIKKELKQILPALRDIEETVMLEALQLPNRIHVNTPISQDRIEDSHKTEDLPTNTISHITIGEMFDLIKLSSIGYKAYYLKDSLALLEQALVCYFSDRMCQEGFTQMACPEFFKNLVVEGCGMDPDNPQEVLKLQSKPGDTSASFLNGVSIMSFVAYLTKCKITASSIPLKYFTCGRSYTPGKTDDLPGLFGVTQSVKVNSFTLCSSQEDAEKLLLETRRYMWDVYRQFGPPCRLVTVAATKLHKSEELRMEIQMWARSVQQYIKVASVSMVSDYISRRLMIRQGENTLPVYMVHSEALDVTRLISILMEYGTIHKDTYTLPNLEFLENYWIQPK